jgi:integrase
MRMKLFNKEKRGLKFKLNGNGEDITYVSKIVGHENVKVTLEKYSEYIPVKNDKFGEIFEL